MITQPQVSQQLNQILNQSGKCFLDHDQTLDSQQQYVRLSTFWYYFLALITIIGLPVTLISNMIIVYLFTSTASLRKSPSSIIAFNLSLSDLIYCAQWPSEIYSSLTQSTRILDLKFVCQSFGIITLSTSFVSIMTVSALSMERAFVIRYPILARRHLTTRLAYLITALIWIVSLCFCVPPLFGKFNRYTLDPSKTSCTLDYLSRRRDHKLYMLVIFAVFFTIPALTITISYIVICATFRKSSLTLRQLSQSTQQIGSLEVNCAPLGKLATRWQLERQAMQFRIALMSFYLIVLWLVAWTPIASLSFLNSIIDCHRASETAVFMASTMTKLGPAFDVFIYGISHPRIKSRFKRIIWSLFTLGF